jgi:hypothetical protein
MYRNMPVTESDWDTWVLIQKDAKFRFWYLYYMAVAH